MVAKAQVLPFAERISDFSGGPVPVLSAGSGVIGEGKEEAPEAVMVFPKVRPHYRFGTADLSRVAYGHENLVRLVEDAQAFHCQ
jgi:hypothetical protein